MGVELPRNSRELLPHRGVAAVRRRSRMSTGRVAGVMMMTAATAVVLAVADARTIQGGVWILAPLVAAAGWGYAVRRATARAKLAFQLLEAAAATALAAHLLSTAPGGPGTAAAAAVPYLVLLPHVLIVVAAALLLGPSRGRLWRPDLAADAAILVLAAVVGSLRFVVEPVLGAGAPVGFEAGVLSALQATAVVPVPLAALVVLRRSTTLSPWAGALLLSGTAALAGGVLFPLVTVGVGWLTQIELSELLIMAGWLLLAGAGYSARTVPSTAHAMLAGRRAPDAVRKLVAPATALFLAAVVVDMGLGRVPRPETVIVAALLAVALSARSAQAAIIVDRDADRRRQLAHTRALVDVTHALAGTTDLDDTLRVISESARAVFGTRGAGIELLTEDGMALETRSAVGLPGDAIGLRFPLEGSFTGWVVRHEEPRATADPSRDPYIQPESLSFLGQWPVAAAPIQFRGETLGALFACIRNDPFDAEELELLGALAEQAAIAIQHARLFARVTILSVTDPLTGLANRRQLERELAREVAAAERGRSLAVVIFDVDGFKEYNDTYGHIAGDRALQAFARALKDETRAMNLAARYGGDEFVAVLAGTGLIGAHTFIDRVRLRFDAAVRELGHGPLSFTAGAAVHGPGVDGPEALLKKADDELYRTKPVRA
jgi:diguanylate cyclase (GGDEF)-like protein